MVSLRINIHRLALVAIVAAVVPACGNDSPSKPTPVSPIAEQPVARPPPPVVTIQVMGTVIDGAGLPVAGVSVALWTELKKVVSVTDGTGAYRAEVDTVYNGTNASVEKAGFEPALHWVDLDRQRPTVRDLRIHQIVTVNAGSQLRFEVRSGDGGCGFDLEFLCRRIRVRSTSAGRLTMRVDRDGPGPDVGLLIGTVNYPYQSTPALRIDVAANSETPVDVLVSWGTFASLGLTLSTSLE